MAKHSKSFYRLFFGTSLSTLGLVVSTPSLAWQASATGISDVHRSIGLEDIIVTAQKRSEPLQKVAVSAQVVTGEAIEKQNVTSIANLSQTVPDIHIVTSGNLSNALAMRGIGSGTGNSGFDQSVAMFVDDVYYGRSRMITSSFLDMERVEVLKGPQTTFFGNSAIAGALNMVTKKPGHEFEGNVRALYGNYGTYALEGAVTTPVSDTFSLRIAGNVNGTSGWIRNVVTDKKAPRSTNWLGRVTAAFTPSEKFDATLKLEIGRSETHGSATDYPFQFVNCPPPAYITNVNRVNRYCSSALASGTPTGFGNNLNAGLAGQFADLKWYNATLSMNYYVGDHTITSVSAYMGYKFRYAQDAVNVIDPGFVNTRFFDPEEYSQISQELRLTSPEDRPISYLLGFYYQHDVLKQKSYNNADLFTASILDGSRKYEMGGVTGNPLFDNSLLFPYLPIGVLTDFRQAENIYSGFGATTWNVTDKLKLNLGLRYMVDRKSYVGKLINGSFSDDFGGFTPLPDENNLQNIILGVGLPGTYNPGARDDRQVMYTLGTQYQVKPDVMAYATFSHGFKAGGYSTGQPTFRAPQSVQTQGQPTPSYGPEKVDAYEVGIKSKLFSNRLLFNLTLFRQDYKGLQVVSLVPSGVFFQGVEFKSNLTQNVAAARSQGVELETEWLASRDLRFKANATYLDAKYVKYKDAQANLLQAQAGQSLQDLSGQPLDFAPKWSLSGQAEYTARLADDRRLVASLMPIYQSKYFNSDATNEPLYRIPGKLRLDAKITLETDHGWAIDVIGKNITDEIIPIAQNERLGAKQAPRTVSFQFRYAW